MAKKKAAKGTISELIEKLATPDSIDTDTQEAAPTAVAPAETAETPEPRLVVPDAVGGIQVNFCKNPSCANFSVPAEGTRRKQGGWQGGPDGGAKKRAPVTERYKTSGSEAPTIQCQSCGEWSPIKSNQGIKEEVDRMSAYLEKQKPPYCTNDECENHKNRVPASSADYRLFGTTTLGSPRWQCKRCGKTISQPLKSTQGQKKSHDNVSIFRALMNRAPLKAISRINDISMKTVYDKIDFIYDQCVAFAGHRERELPNLKKKRMEISVDRQEHIINWYKTGEKKNIRLHAIASVDNKSGYVFGSHLNYDPSLSLRQIEKELHQTQNHKLPPPFRKYARLWSRSDHLATVLDATKTTLTTLQKKAKRKKIDELVDAVYKEAAERPDVEAYDALDAYCRLPEWGMQVHAEYTLYGHFVFLKGLLGGVDYIRFYMDQDSGIRAACLGAFANRVLDKSCDAFYVKVGKELSQAEKLNRVAQWEWVRDEFVATHTGYEEAYDFAVRRAIVEERMRSMTPHGKWDDHWLEHPFATMSEPEKMVCYLTNLKDHGFDQSDQLMAMMYDRASLHYVDSFFMQGRRRISMFERAVSSASSAGRKWHGYSAYRPVMIAKLLEIFRVYHNYVIETEGTKRKRLKPGMVKRKKGTVVKKSPAMRLGLAKGHITEEDILYFVPKRG